MAKLFCCVVSTALLASHVLAEAGHSTGACVGGVCETPALQSYVENSMADGDVSLALMQHKAWEEEARDELLSSDADKMQTLLESDFYLDGIVRLLDFTKTELVVNNLGGQGPEKVLANGEEAPEEMRFRNLVQGRRVDLVVTTEEGYKAFNPTRNGILGGNGQINAASGSTVPLTFSFVDEGTNTPHEMPKFFITFSDIDERHKGKDQESIQVDGFEKYYTNDDLKKIEKDGEAPIFASSDYGNYDDNEFSPDSPLPTQLSHAVTYLFLKKTSFKAIYRISGQGHKGRNVLFSGISQLVFCQETSTYLNFSQAEVTVNNLGGQGPGTGPEELRYGHIAEHEGQKLDLVVKSREPYGYKPWNVSQNGHHGDFGHINLFCGQTKTNSETWAEFTIVKQGTDEPVALEQFAFVVFDFDTGNHEQQVEYIEIKPNAAGFEGGNGYSSFIVTQTSEVLVKEMQTGRKRFIATKHGTEHDNPKSSQNMAREVADKSVVFTFRQTSSFVMLLGITPTGFDTGRNFMFSGQDMYLMCD